jgi:crossover junction endodeoxyribonuclease RusA
LVTGKPNNEEPKLLIPFEFIVIGSPVSLQTNNRTLLQSWKAKVRQAAAACLAAGTSPTIDPIQVIITHYYTGQPPDIDNIIKPIIDALNLLVYVDDKQVTDLTVKRRNFRDLVISQTTHALIAQAIANGENFIHVKIDVPPEPIELSI